MAPTLRERWETRRGWAGRRDVAVRPSAALFARVRLRLTLWYIGVLAVALILAGAVLYVGVRQALLHNVDGTLAAAALPPTGYRVGGGPVTCPFRGPSPPGGRVIGIACYAPDGSLLAASDIAAASPALTGGAILAEASRRGTAYDTVDGGGNVGVIRRYAVANPDADHQLGIALYGLSIRGETQALRTLVIGLLATGILALLIAALGGLFLAARALGPLRLALQRQRAFIADASHELRTPLTLLRADADVLLRSRNRLPEEDAALVTDIAAEAAHMSKLTTTMLDLARLDADETRLEHDVVDLSTVCHETVRRAAAYARAAGVTSEYGPCGNVLTIGDRTLLTQATLTLVDNAIKYSRAGGRVTVRADRIGTRAVITVTDTGIGIAAGDLHRLGERFYRPDKARSRETGGAGLGIAIARTIASMHGGTLTYRSAPEEGTTATLSLPGAQADMRASAG